MDRIVLKGGNAIDLIHGVSLRSSQDLDFSIPDEFDRAQLHELQARIGRRLTESFAPDGYKVFDVGLFERPSEQRPGQPRFWGGYRLEFKIIGRDTFDELGGRIDVIRRNATVIGSQQKRIMQIDISKYEYCDGKEQRELGGLVIYVYSPAMLVVEKLRAICQQMVEYSASVPNPGRSPRARDFFDIYNLIQRFQPDITSHTFQDLVKAIFAAKSVPLELLNEVANVREFHRDNFHSVRATAKRGHALRDFNFYFDYVVGVCERLKPIWEV